MVPKLRKNFSLIATFAVIMVIAIVGYFVIGLQKAPYAVASFESFTYRWGTGDVLENSYSSDSGVYHYLNNRDSLIKTKIKLRPNDIIYIHNKINELGFWKLPNSIGKPNAQAKVPVYELQFRYNEKSKKVIIYSDFEENPQLLDSAMKIQQVIQKTLDEAEARYHQ